MSEARNPSAAVVALPSAATAKVRQPEYHARYAARRRCFREGSLVRFPGEFVSPEARRAVALAQAETAERNAIYAEGNLYRNGPLLLLTALWAATPDAQQEHALAFLTVAGMGDSPDPAVLAAVTYAKAMRDSVKALAESGT